MLPLYAKIREILSDRYELEIIMVDDNSLDDSWNKILQLYKKETGDIKGIRFKHNHGQHEALLFGIRLATGKYIITIDEDMQHDPGYIPPMLAFMIANDLDVVYGKFHEYRKNFLRKLESDMGRRFAGFLIPLLHKDYSPFRIIRLEIAKDLAAGNGTVFLDAMLGRVTSKIGAYSIEHLESGRPSSYSPMKRGLLALSIFTSYSSLFSWLAVTPRKRKIPQVAESIGL